MSHFLSLLAIQVYPNGDGAGRGTHVSVKVALMPGEFDDLLCWPCIPWHNHRSPPQPAQGLVPQGSPDLVHNAREFVRERKASG